MSTLGRIVSAPLIIEYDFAEVNPKAFRHEYDTLAETDEDPVGQWLRIARARGETRDSDSVLIHLVVELHRKIDNLTQIIQNETPSYVKLGHVSHLEGIGHGVFIMEKPLFTPEREYYGRINLPAFPQRIVPVYFKTLDQKSAEITLMHERDVKDWDTYLTARERALIREQKGRN